MEIKIEKLWRDGKLYITVKLINESGIVISSDSIELTRIDVMKLMAGNI